MPAPLTPAFINAACKDNADLGRRYKGPIRYV